MFIKKDLRRIEEILQDKENDETLKFSKRTAEFNGSIHILCYEKHVELMKNVKIMNLYDNKLVSINGIERFRGLTMLQELNLGSNQLTSIPTEVMLPFSVQIIFLNFLLIVWPVTIFKSLVVG
jgi:Leucine-rich repeat (LRR) protein